MKPVLKIKASTKPVLKLKPKLRLVANNEEHKEEPKLPEENKILVDVRPNTESQPRASNGRFAKKAVATAPQVKPEQEAVKQEQQETPPAAPSTIQIQQQEEIAVEQEQPQQKNDEPEEGCVSTVELPPKIKASWQEQAMTLIEDCEHRESKMNDWERIFLDSVRALVVAGVMLSKKQEQKLNDLWDRVTEKG